jgi:hypothetical protein
MKWISAVSVYKINPYFILTYLLSILDTDRLRKTGSPLVATTRFESFGVNVLTTRLDSTGRKLKMFGIWKTGENWSRRVVAVFTPKDATEQNCSVASRLLVWTRLRRDGTEQNSSVPSRLSVWMGLRRDATEQFCSVPSRRLVWTGLKCIG